MEQLIPWLYLKGISTGDFSDALVALVGKRCYGLVCPHDKPAQSGLAAGISAMAKA